MWETWENRTCKERGELGKLTSVDLVNKSVGVYFIFYAFKYFVILKKHLGFW